MQSINYDELTREELFAIRNEVDGRCEEIESEEDAKELADFLSNGPYKDPMKQHLYLFIKRDIEHRLKAYELGHALPKPEDEGKIVKWSRWSPIKEK